MFSSWKFETLHLARTLPSHGIFTSALQCEKLFYIILNKMSRIDGQFTIEKPVIFLWFKLVRYINPVNVYI
jgi:hypothetical protein|uniref:Uncharacterized protein n=1 Tax=Populus trichocarpa TaxID=3694 RepID=U5FWZ8_POPTR